MSETITQDGDKFFGLDCSPITITRAGQTYTYLLDSITFTNPSSEVTDNDDSGRMDDQTIIQMPKEGSAVLQIKKGTPVPLPGESFELTGTRNDGLYLIRTSDEPQSSGAYLKSNITFRKKLNTGDPANPTLHFVGGSEDKTFTNYEAYVTATTDGSLGVTATDYLGQPVPITATIEETSGQSLENWEEQSVAWFETIRYTARDADGRTATRTRRHTIQAQS